jgi:hypothetical protein
LAVGMRGRVGEPVRNRPYLTDADLLIIHALLSGAPIVGMTHREMARADDVRARLRQWVEERAERKAKLAAGRRGSEG